MDPKQVRKTVDNLLADLRRNPALGRPLSFLRRVGQPLGLGLAIGIGSVAGCGSDNNSSQPRDAVAVDTRDALPPSGDVYGATTDGHIAPSDARDALPPSVDIYGATVDGPGAQPDTRDVLPPPADVYGIASLDARWPVDAQPAETQPLDGGSVLDAVPPPADMYGITYPVDTRDAIPSAGDIYGVSFPPVDPAGNRG